MLDEAFRATVASFEGSVAIAANAAVAPDHLLLALRGSGQALYVGLAEDAYIVASEPYGLVEETSRYIRMDGETPANVDNPTASRGQLVVARRRRGPARSKASSASVTTAPCCPVTDDDVVVAQITTRDIDRGNYPHFLLKEISESPASFRKTLRGKLVDATDASSSRSVTRRCLPTIRDDLAVRCDHARGRDRPGHGARRRSELRARRCESMARDTSSESTRRWPPSCPGSACAPT